MCVWWLVRVAVIAVRVAGIAVLGVLLLRCGARVLLLAGLVLAVVGRLGRDPSVSASMLSKPLSFGPDRTTPSVKTRLVYYKLSWN